MTDTRALIVVLVSVLLLLLSACGGTPQPAPAPAATEPSASVRVGLTEWTVLTSNGSVLPGKVELVVTNSGATEHDLVVEGRAGEWETPDLRPGEQATLTVTARSGERLHLWCDLPGHEAQGMHAELDVADG